VPVLTLDVGGPNEMDIDCERGGHAAPRKVGDRGYSGSGSEWSQIRAELMVVPVVTAPLLWSQIATIRTMFALGKRVNCAGDVLNKPGTIVFSGTITDELHETADRGTLNLTLFEVGSTLTYTPTITQFILSGADWGDGTYIATPLVSGPIAGDVTITFDVMDAVSPATCSLPTPCCAISYSPDPVIIWLSKPFQPVVGGIPFVTGTPSATILGIGDAGDARWCYQSTKAVFTHVRDGVDVDTPVESGWVASFFAGGDATYTATSSVIWAIQPTAVEQIRVELWGRIGLAGGGTDNSNRQRLFWGGSPSKYLTVGGGPFVEV